MERQPGSGKDSNLNRRICWQPKISGAWKITQAQGPPFFVTKAAPRVETKSRSTITRTCLGYRNTSGTLPVYSDNTLKRKRGLAYTDWVTHAVCYFSITGKIWHYPAGRPAARSGIHTGGGWPIFFWFCSKTDLLPAAHKGVITMLATNRHSKSPSH